MKRAAWILSILLWVCFLFLAGCREEKSDPAIKTYTYTLDYITTLADRGNVHGKVTLYFDNPGSLARMRQHRARFQQALDLIVRPYRTRELNPKRMGLIIERVTHRLYSSALVSFSLKDFETRNAAGKRINHQERETIRTFHDG